MKDRFDLEDEIMKLFSFVDDIQAVVAYISETDTDPKIIDNVSNILLGTSTLLGLHADKMLDTMSQCFELDEYNKFNFDEEKKAESLKKCFKNCCDTSSINPIHDMCYDPNS